MVSQLWIFKIRWKKCPIIPNINTIKPNIYLHRRNLLRHTTSSKHTRNQTNISTKHDSSGLFHVVNVLSNVTFSQFTTMLYVFWGQWSRGKDDNQGQESNSETCTTGTVPKSTRYAEESQNQKEWSVQNCSWKVVSGWKISHELVGTWMDRRTNSDNMTHLHGKVILTRLHLENEADTRSLDTFLWTKKEFKVRLSNALIFVKESTRIFKFSKKHVESTGEGHGPIHLAKQARHHRQQFKGVEEYNNTVDFRIEWRF